MHLWCLDVLGRIICGADENFHKHQTAVCPSVYIRLQRQVSYFGNEEGITGLLKHIAGEDVSCQVLRMLWEDRFEENIPYFSEWAEVTDASLDTNDELESEEENNHGS